MTEEYIKGYRQGVDDALMWISTVDMLPDQNRHGLGSSSIIAYGKRDILSNLKEYEYFEKLSYKVKWLQDNFKFWKPVDRLELTWLEY